MTSLSQALAFESGLQLGIATAYQGLDDTEFEDGGVQYFTRGQKCRSFYLPGKRDMEWCKAVIRRWRPDVVHIHGTERFYGLLAQDPEIDVPIVISIQGLLRSCVQHHFGVLSSLDVVRATRPVEFATGRGLVWDYVRRRRVARQESIIIAKNRIFLGRTYWDRAQLRYLNNTAAYFHVGEVLRPVFYGLRWEAGLCDPRTIAFSNAGDPRRGTEVLLRALKALLGEFPDVRLRLAGSFKKSSGYSRFLLHLLRRLGLADKVEFLGYLGAEELARVLCRAHVFAQPTLVDNSPNSLCEAMALGVPCVASFAGGIPSLVSEGQSGLLFPPGDPAVLAERIREIFVNPELAAHLSAAAREVSGRRHAPQVVVSQLLGAYRAAIALV
jgi:glycosyltransferase involved in cell wall biosynthesis